MRNFYKDRKSLTLLFSVVASFLLVTVVTFAATTISTNISTAGNLTVSGSSTLTGEVGVASTSPYVALGITGTTTSSAGMVIGGGGSAITQMRFGTCAFDPASITASTSVSTNCTSATGVTTNDKVFVTPVSLENGLVMISASSTGAGIIQVTILNTGQTFPNGAAVNPAPQSWYWMAIR